MASTAVTEFKEIKQEQLQEFLHDSIQVPDDLQSNVLVTTLDKVYNWSRRNSMWPLCACASCHVALKLMPLPRCK